MKLAYNELKELVKEALVEILQEGLGSLLVGQKQQVEDDDEFEEEKSVKQAPSQIAKQHNLKKVSAPFNAVAENHNKKVSTLTNMYEAKTLQKMGNQLAQQKQQQSTSTKISKESINKMTDDPLMASIFADTAKTTLQEQIDAERKGGNGLVGSDAASLVVAQSDPMDIFGDVADNWAKMAFSSQDLIKKK
jgi:hypothetical protein